MIFELLIGLGLTATVWMPLLNRRFNKPTQYGGYFDFDQLPALESSAPVLSDEVELITELLNQDDGWTLLGSKYYRHKHGLMVVLKGGERYNGLGDKTPEAVSVIILDEKESPQTVKMNPAETKHVTAKFKAFIARQETNKQRDLGKVLASRIVSGTAVGQPAGPEPEVDNLGQSDTVPTLHWDAVTQSIVALGRDGAKQLVPTEAFKERYGLVPTTINKNYLAYFGQSNNLGSYHLLDDNGIKRLSVGHNAEDLIWGNKIPPERPKTVLIAQ